MQMEISVSGDGGITWIPVRSFPLHLLNRKQVSPPPMGMNADTELHGSGVRESEPLTRSGLGGPDAMESLKMTCQVCKFWQKWDNEFCENGNCRRHAPTVIPYEHHKPYIDTDFPFKTSLWPSTHCDEWCGEYVARIVE